MRLARLTALSQRVVDELEADPENAIATPLSPFSFLTLPTVTTAEQQLPLTAMG